MHLIFFVHSFVLESQSSSTSFMTGKSCPYMVWLLRFGVSCLGNIYTKKKTSQNWLTLPKLPKILIKEFYLVSLFNAFVGKHDSTKEAVWARFLCSLYHVPCLEINVYGIIRWHSNTILEARSEAYKEKSSVLTI